MTKKTRLLLLGALSLVVALAGTASGEMTTGTYPGNGATQQIQGLGFQPDLLIIKRDGPTDGVARISTMPAGLCKDLDLDGPEGLYPNVISSLDADGFTVENDDYVNTSGSQYYYAAFRAEPGFMYVGQYTGDGAGDRGITAPGFSPAYVVVVSEGADDAIQRFASEPDSSSHIFTTDVRVYDAIRTFTPTGFRVGDRNEVNRAGTVYHYVAFAAGLDVEQGTYRGDALDDRIVPTGFQPDYLLVRSQTSFRTAHRMREHVGDASLFFTAIGNQINTIKDFLPAGFQVGIVDQVNADGIDYHWIAFGAGVPSADLAVTTAIDPVAPRVDDSVTLSVTVDNVGPQNTAQVEISAPLPAGLTVTEDTPSVGSYDRGTGSWQIGNLLTSQQVTLDLTATVDAGTEGQTLDFAAAVAFSSVADPVGSNDSDLSQLTVVAPDVVDITASSPSLVTAYPGAPALEVARFTFFNAGASTDTLNSFAIDNALTGPGSQAQLDASWSTLTLYVDSGSGLQVPATSTGAPDVTAAMASGSATFLDLRVLLDAGETLDLVVTGAPSVAARDGDAPRIALAGPSSASWSPPVALTGSWPLSPPAAFVVDGMSADQIQIHEVVGSLGAGTDQNLVLDLLIPSNGYQADTLQRLNLVNLGTATPVDLRVLRGWVDDGDGFFDAALDALLGDFQFTGDRWEITGLSVPIPSGGARVFCTADVEAFATPGATLRWQLPSLPDVAIGMSSANDGPLDRPIESTSTRSISISDRVTLTSTVLAPQTVAPGSTDLRLLTLVATNSYDTAQRLTSLSLTNATTSAHGGTLVDLDGALDQLDIRIDGDDDGTLDDIATDPLVGSATFTNGRANFNGLNWDLPSGDSRVLFVTGRTSLRDAADEDVLRITLTQGADVGFEDPPALAATWPIEGSAFTIDGMVAAQISVGDAPSSTHGPDDGPIVALDVAFPSNGYATDVLEAVAVENLGTAQPGDLSELRLWRDGGDGVFTGATGDDLDLGAMSWSSGRWTSAPMTQAIPISGLRVFVTLVVSGTPTDGSTVRLSLPVEAVLVQSSNDGPRDAAVISAADILLSSSPLLASIEVSPTTTVEGTDVTVRMVIENTSSETVEGIAPSVLVTEGDGAVSLLTGPQPASLDLASDAIDTFTWTYSTSAIGTVRLRGNASGVGQTSGLIWPSDDVRSSEILILEQLDEISLYPVATLPRSVNRGQGEVAALTLTLTTDGNTDASGVRVQGFGLRLEDDQGMPVDPQDVVSRVTVSEGSISYLDRTDLGTGSMDLTFSTPIVVESDPVSLVVRFEVSDTTTVPAFRAVIEADTDFTAEDVASNFPVNVISATGFPIRTGLANIVDESTEVVVSSALARPDLTVNQGQTAIDLLSVTVENPGISGLTADAVISNLVVQCFDGTGIPVASPAQFLDRIRLVGPVATHVDRAILGSDGTDILLTLSPPVSVPVNAPFQLRVAGDVSGDALGTFRIRLAGEQTLEARDANTGADLEVTYANPPLEGGLIVVQLPAASLLASGQPRLSASTSIGAENVTALTTNLRHPSGPGTAGIAVRQLVIGCRDETRSLLAPMDFLDGLRILHDGSVVGTAPSLPTSAQSFGVDVGSLAIAPGEVLSLEIEIDVEESAPAGYLELVIETAGIEASDSNSGAILSVLPDDGASVPLSSGLTRLLPPADELEVELDGRLPPMLVADDREQTVAVLELTNPTDGEAAIQVETISVDLAERDLTPLLAGSVLTELRAYQGDALWATTGSIAPNQERADVLAVVPLDVVSQATVALELRAVFRAEPSAASVRFGVNQAGVQVLQPGGGLPQVRVESVEGLTFPQWTEAGSFTVANLESSYSNFPNPFAAGREATTFVFALPQDGTVSLTIFSPRGERVVELVSAEPRIAGLYQVDRWTGHNGRGVTVLNGVYVAELKVDFVDGSRERVLRKVMVVR